MKPENSVITKSLEIESSGHDNQKETYLSETVLEREELQRAGKRSTRSTGGRRPGKDLVFFPSSTTQFFPNGLRREEAWIRRFGLRGSFCLALIAREICVSLLCGTDSFHDMYFFFLRRNAWDRNGESYPIASLGAERERERPQERERDTERERESERDRERERVGE